MTKESDNDAYIQWRDKRKKRSRFRTYLSIAAILMAAAFVLVLKQTGLVSTLPLPLLIGVSVVMLVVIGLLLFL